MKATLSRIIMALTIGCLGESRRDWAAAMEAEFETAAADGEQLSFAWGCLVAAWRNMLTAEEGHFILTSYAIALGLFMPMAALQVGCALFGLPYLYPGSGGLPGALLEGGAYEHLIRGVYQAAILPLALLQLLIGFGHVRIAWGMLERDWTGVTRAAMRTLAGAATLILFMAILFLNNRQAVLQGAILGVELTIIALLARWHEQLPASAEVQQLL